MKISVTGPSGAGKTFLAKELSIKYSLNHINLDYVFFKHVQGTKSQDLVNENERRKYLNDTIKENSWIIEGARPVIKVFDSSDLIIFLKPPALIALYHQWKRYFTDSAQRKEHGFINNIRLSKIIVKQYMEKEDISQNNDPLYSSVRKLERILKVYGNKVIVLKNRKDISRLLSSEKLPQQDLEATRLSI